MANADFSNWDEKQYAILIPMTELITHPGILSANPADFFVEGIVKLNSYCWCLCPEEKTEQVRKSNPNLSVMGYQAPSVRGLTNLFLENLGYQKEAIGVWSWENEAHVKEYQQRMIQHGISKFSHHCSSENKHIEDLQNGISFLKAFQELRLLPETLSKEQLDALHACIQIYRSLIYKECRSYTALDPSTQELAARILGYDLKELEAYQLENHFEKQPFLDDLATHAFHFITTPISEEKSTESELSSSLFTEDPIKKTTF